MCQSHVSVQTLQPFPFHSESNPMVCKAIRDSGSCDVSYFSLVHSIQATLASFLFIEQGTLLPQGFCLWHSLCLKHPSPDVCLARSLTFFRSLLNYHLLGGTFLVHPLQNHNSCPSPCILLILLCFSSEHLLPSDFQYILHYLSLLY